jgi:hypothetical protein
MDCPLLTHNRSNTCRSTSSLLAHTLFSSDKYCKGAWFTLCPLFRNTLSIYPCFPIQQRSQQPAGN